MPAIRGHRSDKKKEYICDHDDCHKSFTRPYDLQRHKRTHCGYDDREFGCEYPGCNFRANQLAGLRCHINSIHKGVRLHCDYPGCEKTFSDPSSRSKHKQKFHGQEASEPDNTVDVDHSAAEDDPGHPLDAQSQPRKHIAPYVVPVHISVARHVEQHSRNDVRDILSQFATFALTNEEGSSASTAAIPSQSEPSSEAVSSYATSSVSRSASSEPSFSAHSPSSSLPSTPCELPGVLPFTCSVNDWQTPFRGRFDADFLLNSAQLYLGNPLENQRVGFGGTPTPGTAHNLAETFRLESYSASSGQESSTYTMPLLQSDLDMPNPVQANYMNYADSSLFTAPNLYVAPTGQIPDKVSLSVLSPFQTAGYENMDQWNNVSYITPGVEYLGFPHVGHWQTGNFTHF